jgi:glycerol-3-phosphate dehydrogenase subunit C
VMQRRREAVKRLVPRRGLHFGPRVRNEMTTTYQPSDSAYFDEADTRREMARVFDVCNGCRLCTDVCGVFPDLFERLSGLGKDLADQMTPAQQDAVAERCFQCKLCYLRCPYIPGASLPDSGRVLDIDFPRLMLRAAAIRQQGGHLSPIGRFRTSLLNRTDLLGGTGVKTSRFSNRLIGAPPGSVARRAMAAVTGVSAVRLIPPYARQRFSTWFAKQAGPSKEIQGRAGGATTPIGGRRRVSVFATCSVEYLQPEIGQALIEVYQRNQIDCSLSAAKCCGAPWLHSGDAQKFAAIAKENVQLLAEEIRAGKQIVVPQPTCGYVLKEDYRIYASGQDADLVASQTRDAVEYLWEIAKDPGGGFDTQFDGEIPSHLAYHSPCHLRAQGLSETAADLLSLMGTRVSVVSQCAGIDGLWGLRKGNEAEAMAQAEDLVIALNATGAEVSCGDCHLANTAVAEQSARVPLHPLQVLARAYEPRSQP